MPYTTMWAYPWDLLDEGPPAVARRLKDEVGLDAVSVATVYHTYDQVRPHLGGRLIRADRAYAYFTPRPQYYKSTPLQPTPRWPHAEGDPMAEITGSLEAAGLDLISWTVALHNTALGEAHPDVCQRNALGDRFTFALCPANPATRAYLLGLVADLADNYHLARLELESAHYHNFWHIHFHEKVGVELGPVERYLYGLCFCEACAVYAKAANVDIERMKALARERLEAFFSTGEPAIQTPEELLSDEQGFAAFADVREVVVSSLLRDVRERINCELGLILSFDRLNEGIGHRKVLEIAEYCEILAYSANVAANERKLRTLAESGLDLGRLVVGLCAHPPASPDAGTLIENVQRCLALGVRNLSFYNYGIMTFEHLNWVAEAVKAANEA